LFCRRNVWTVTIKSRVHFVHWMPTSRHIRKSSLYVYHLASFSFVYQQSTSRICCKPGKGRVVRKAVEEQGSCLSRLIRDQAYHRGAFATPRDGMWYCNPHSNCQPAPRMWKWFWILTGAGLVNALVSCALACLGARCIRRVIVNGMTSVRAMVCGCWAKNWEARSPARRRLQQCLTERLSKSVTSLVYKRLQALHKRVRTKKNAVCSFYFAMTYAYYQ
jgi:hypothetical protein